MLHQVANLELEIYLLDSQQEVGYYRTLDAASPAMMSEALKDWGNLNDSLGVTSAIAVYVT